MNLSLNLNSFDFPTHLKPFMGIFWDITHPYKLFASKYIFFLYQRFLHRHWRFTGQQGKRGDHLLFLSTTSTRSRTLRHLFATLHVRWLSRIFNRNACVYQTATRWDLPPYRITIWVIDWWCNVCLFTWWIDIRFLLQWFDIGNRWIWTRIVYHPCITNRLTKYASHPESVLVTSLL